MKIEVCEQMLAAWLNHIKGCQLVQTNWIPSPVAVENLSEETLTSIGEFVSAINRFSEENNLDIFKHSTVKQMVGQCEIDIVGVRLEDGIVQKVYLIDSAFHENGLNYGDVVARVLKKILRAIFVADASFRNIPAQIVFVSPKCGKIYAKFCGARSVSPRDRKTFLPGFGNSFIVQRGFYADCIRAFA